MEPFLSNTLYNKLKWITLILLPALATLYGAAAVLLGLPAGTKVVGALALLATFLGTLLGLSTKAYNGSESSFDGVLEVNKYDPSILHSLNLDNTSPNDLKRKKSVTMKVVKVDAELPDPDVS